MCEPEVQEYLLEQTPGAEGEAGMTRCIYLDCESVKGYDARTDIPALAVQKPIVYCYARSRRQCPKEAWEITDECWGMK